VLDWDMQSRPDSKVSGVTGSYASAARAAPRRTNSGSEMEVGSASMVESEADGSASGRVLTRRKRSGKSRLWQGLESDSDVSEVAATRVSPIMSAPKVPRASKSKGRGGHSHSVGLSQARRELEVGPVDSESSTLTETDIEPVLMPAPSSVPSKSKGSGSPLLLFNMTVEELQSKAESGAQEIERVLRTSKNLKGTSVKEVREAALSVMKVVRALASRDEGEEVRRLTADNRRLRGQMSALSEEVAALRRAFSEREVPPKQRPEPVVAASPVPTEKATAGLTRQEFVDAMGALQKQLMLHIGGVISARLEGLEVDGRLLPAQSHRPPLSVGKTSLRPSWASVTAAAPSGPTTLSPPANMPKQAGPKKASKKGAPKGEASRSVEQVAGSSKEVQPLVVDDGWTTVAPKPRKAPARAAAPAAKPTPKVPKPPKSLAVVVALKPEALAQGATYAAALTQAREKVSLSELGIGAGKFRRSLTGACVIELPKDTTASQADALAARMGEVLGEAATVSRPTKMADIRVSGLDDSVSARSCDELWLRSRSAHQRK
jgi:hypothetical protein